MPLFSMFAASKNSQRFDLPFHARLGTEFLVFLTALMTILCLLSVTASLSLTQLAKKWTSGLENTLTVEIPYSETQTEASARILSALKDADGVLSAKLMSRDAMASLLAPWLGDSVTAMKDLPMPVLITIDLKERNSRVVHGLTQMVRDISPKAKVDAHEQWLTDLVRFTNTLKIAALMIMFSIGLVTSLTVAGAVRSRMAIHHTELELLHIMGADDSYIAKQFQKYIYWLCGRGVLLGFIVCAITVGIMQAVSMASSEALPGLRLSLLQFSMLPVTAIILFLISGWTARITALNVLRAMP
jgi:cell division transport system permease protein